MQTPGPPHSSLDDVNPWCKTIFVWPCFAAICDLCTVKIIYFILIVQDFCNIIENRRHLFDGLGLIIIHDIINFKLAFIFHDLRRHFIFEFNLLKHAIHPYDFIKVLSQLFMETLATKLLWGINKPLKEICHSIKYVP